MVLLVLLLNSYYISIFSRVELYYMKPRSNLAYERESARMKKISADRRSSILASCSVQASVAPKP